MKENPLKFLSTSISLILISSLSVLADNQILTFINNTSNFEAQLKDVTSGPGQTIRWDMPSVDPGKSIPRTWYDTTLGFGTAHLLVTKTSTNSHQAIDFKLQPGEIFNEGKPWKPFEAEDRAAHSKTTSELKLTLDFRGKFIQSSTYGDYWTDIKVILSEEQVDL